MRTFVIKTAFNQNLMHYNIRHFFSENTHYEDYSLSRTMHLELY